jgi:RNA polymerase sigma-70 factor (ECF subfamily)
VNHPEDENELIARAKTDSAAFGLLYERYVAKIYNYVYYRTGDHHEAEDLTARTFQRAMAHVSRYRDQGVPFSAWLYRIAHNLVANWHRDRGRRQLVGLDDVAHLSAGARPESAAEVNEERAQLLSAIRRLPDERQQLLILKFVEHLSNAEIGKVMGRTEGAVKSLYHRTLLSLRDELGLAALPAGKDEPA